MTYDTIDNDVTMAGSAEGALLANRYRIVRPLGQGGMGSVWLAEDTQLDNKPFAIKMLPSILVSNKRAYRQLKDEALVAMKLTHPNIVTLRAFEENNGNPFLVMDYIEGETLDNYLAEHCVATAPSPSSLAGLPESDVLRILKPIAAALDYAHSKGVVHRDVKPGNVMIAKDGTPYILDFGIAREIQETMTRVTGKMSSGTLLYMSPEQLNGDAPKPAQDVYSFAAMAYECLKGEPPFVRGAIEDQIKNKQPEPLPGGPRTPAMASASRTAFGWGIPVAAAIMSGLAKTPEDRPATCFEVLELREISRQRKEAEDTERKMREEAGAAERGAAALNARKEAEHAARHETESHEQNEADGLRHSLNSARGYLIGIWIVMAVLVAIVIYVVSYSPATKRPDKNNRGLFKHDVFSELETAMNELKNREAEEAARRAAAERRELEAKEEDARKKREAEEAARLAEEARRQHEAQAKAERERMARQSLHGRWKCSSAVTANGNRTEFDYECEFTADGIMRLSTSFGGSVNIKETGRWYLTGNRLSVSFTDESAYSCGKKLDRSMFQRTGMTLAYEVRRKADGSFELRPDVSSHIAWHKKLLGDSFVSYHCDNAGVGHLKFKHELIFKDEIEQTYSPKIFCRAQ